ncbi:hypothetical protein CANINC_003899 [Pichia inconspicua]|uniref:Uncharacterized protein n=1 Tax=Pichia inconspicua TaxID=52247 RepID=A0A4T0WXK2_9ASCO|nr:hypothetical protein CANINC_003899 [[Candida] inconspicua]
MSLSADAQENDLFILEKKQRILSLLKHLNSEHLRPIIAKESSKQQPVALTLAKQHIERQVEELSSVDNFLNTVENELKFYKQLDIYMEPLLTSMSTSESINNTTNLSKAHELLSRINQLKIKSRSLSSYIKLIVNKYLFDVEFSHIFNHLDDAGLKSRKQRFLKLLETLLNNNILSTSTDRKYVTLQSLDDPLVRFLIINKIVTVIPPNKIVLKDLSFNL